MKRQGREVDQGRREREQWLAVSCPKIGSPDRRQVPLGKHLRHLDQSRRIREGVVSRDQVSAEQGVERYEREDDEDRRRRRARCRAALAQAAESGGEGRFSLGHAGRAEGVDGQAEESNAEEEEERLQHPRPIRHHDLVLSGRNRHCAEPWRHVQERRALPIDAGRQVGIPGDLDEGVAWPLQVDARCVGLARLRFPDDATPRCEVGRIWWRQGFPATESGTSGRARV
jgi:hypothetical protein